MLFFQIVLFVAGLVVLIAGRMWLPGKATATGRPARIAGLLLMLPLPASLLVNPLIVRLGALGLNDHDVQFLTWMSDSLLFWGGVIGGIVAAHRASQARPSGPPPTASA
jgi:hypothetical protein